MARRRRPSIPLIILFVILLLLFFLAGTLVDIALDVSGNGTITYKYTQGDTTIVSITYDLPQDLAEAMNIKPVTGWTANLANNVLSLTGGSLSPGQSVNVDFKLTKYITGGSKQFTVTGRTADGRVLSNDSSVEVDTLFLGLMWTLYQNAIWLLILAIIVLVVIILLFLKGAKKNEEEQKKE